MIARSVMGRMRIAKAGTIATYAAAFAVFCSACGVVVHHFIAAESDQVQRVERPPHD
jgi:hypothetical protein